MLEISQNSGKLPTPGYSHKLRNGAGKNAAQMATLQHEVSFDKNFAQTQFNPHQQDSHSIEAMHRGDVLASQDFGGTNGAAQLKEEQRYMKNLLTQPARHHDSPAQQKASMYIIESASQNTLMMPSVHEKSGNSIGIKHRTSVGVSEVGSNRSGMSPNAGIKQKRLNQEQQLAHYVSGLEKQIRAY